MENAEKIFKDLYNSLFADIEKYKKDCLSTLVPMKGKQYDSEKKKLMIVGRATNGWGELKDITNGPDQYSRIAWKNLNDTKRFKWIDEEKAKKEKRYNIESSPFWSYSKAVLKELRGSIPDTGWYQYILWSNLFPVSYSDEWNPSETLKRIQFDSARKLIKEQIRYFKPTHVLIMTDWDGWFFMSRNKGEAGEKFIFEINHKNDNEVIKGSGIFEDSCVVVCRRPDYYNKEKFVNYVINEFQSLEKQNT